MKKVIRSNIFVAAVLLLALALFTLVACGGEDDTPAGTNPPPAKEPAIKIYTVADMLSKKAGTAYNVCCQRLGISNKIDAVIVIDHDNNNHIKSIGAHTYGLVDNNLILNTYKIDFTTPDNQDGALVVDFINGEVLSGSTMNNNSPISFTNSDWEQNDAISKAIIAKQGIAPADVKFSVTRKYPKQTAEGKDEFVTRIDTVNKVELVRFSVEPASDVAGIVANINNNVNFNISKTSSSVLAGNTTLDKNATDAE